LEDFCMNDELKAWEESFMRGYLNEAIEEQWYPEKTLKTSFVEME
jgi:hypothetical protein